MNTSMTCRTLGSTMLVCLAATLLGGRSAFALQPNDWLGSWQLYRSADSTQDSPLTLKIDDNKASPVTGSWRTFRVRIIFGNGTSTGIGHFSELTDNNGRAVIMIPSVAGGSMIRYDAHLYQCKRAMSGTFTSARYGSASQFCALKSSTAPPPPPTLRRRADVRAMRIEFQPEQPTQGSPVQVRVTITNQGPSNAGPFKVQWWAGEDFPNPAKVWTVAGMQRGKSMTLVFDYGGYKSFYRGLRTKVVVDPDGSLDDPRPENNQFFAEITVQRK